MDCGHRTRWSTSIADPKPPLLPHQTLYSQQEEEGPWFQINNKARTEKTDSRFAGQQALTCNLFPNYKESALKWEKNVISDTHIKTSKRLRKDKYTSEFSSFHLSSSSPTVPSKEQCHCYISCLWFNYSLSSIQQCHCSRFTNSWAIWGKDHFKCASWKLLKPLNTHITHTVLHD